MTTTIINLSEEGKNKIIEVQKQLIESLQRENGLLQVRINDLDSIINKLKENKTK